MKSIMQGDSYTIPVRISCGGTEITPEIADVVEIAIGDIVKTYPDQIAFSDAWLFPLSQEETFDFAPVPHPMQVRIRFLSGDVVGSACGCISINTSKSKEVLQ